MTSVVLIHQSVDAPFAKGCIHECLLPFTLDAGRWFQLSSLPRVRYKYREASVQMRPNCHSMTCGMVTVDAAHGKEDRTDAGRPGIIKRLRTESGPKVPRSKQSLSDFWKTHKQGLHLRANSAFHASELRFVHFITTIGEKECDWHLSLKPNLRDRRICRNTRSWSRGPETRRILVNSPVFVVCIPRSPLEEIL